MKSCEVCGNKYENMFEIRMKKDMVGHWFDCFECAAQKLAPACAECGVKILGHGVQVGQQIFCSAHCTRAQGYKDIVDHAEARL